MRFILALFLALWFSPVSAQWGGGGGATITNTATNTNRVLCSIRAANFNVTTDQVCAIAAAVTAYTVTNQSSSRTARLQ
jgi:hypothetical protein